MCFLLDTHTFLWFLGGDNELPVDLSNKIKNLENDFYISIASFWEIAIKIKIGKL